LDDDAREKRTTGGVAGRRPARVPRADHVRRGQAREWPRGASRRGRSVAPAGELPARAGDDTAAARLAAVICASAQVRD